MWSGHEPGVIMEFAALLPEHVDTHSLGCHTQSNLPFLYLGLPRFDGQG